MTSKITLMVKRLLVLSALAGAIIAAIGKSNNLAYIGSSFYIICAIAVFINYRRTSILLWLAVLVHAALTGYLIWQWQNAGVIPCNYCLAAAGFTLLAAVAWWKTPIAFLPAVLMAAIWFGWPMIFYPQSVYNQIDGQVTVQSVLKVLIIPDPHPALGE